MKIFFVNFTNIPDMFVLDLPTRKLSDLSGTYCDLINKVFGLKKVCDSQKLQWESNLP